MANAMRSLYLIYVYQNQRDLLNISRKLSYTQRRLMTSLALFPLLAAPMDLFQILVRRPSGKRTKDDATKAIKFYLPNRDVKSDTLAKPHGTTFANFKEKYAALPHHL